VELAGTFGVELTAGTFEVVELAGISGVGPAVAGTFEVGQFALLAAIFEVGLEAGISVELAAAAAVEVEAVAVVAHEVFAVEAGLHHIAQPAGSVVHGQEK